MNQIFVRLTDFALTSGGPRPSQGAAVPSSFQISDVEFLYSSRCQLCLQAIVAFFWPGQLLPPVFHISVIEFLYSCRITLDVNYAYRPLWPFSLADKWKFTQLFLNKVTYPPLLLKFNTSVVYLAPPPDYEA